MAMWKFLSEYGVYGFVFFFLGVWFATGWDISRFVLLSLAVTVTLAVTFLIRYTVRRPRPNFMSTGYVPALKKYSFPSAHASSAFSLATAITMVQLSGGVSAFGLAVAILLYVMATLIAVSRIMVGVHYLADIVAGSVLGVGVTFLMMYFL